LHQFLQNIIGHPYAFYFGSLNVSWYGLAYIITFAVGWIGLLRAYKNKPWIDGLAFILILSGLIGARLFFDVFALLDGSAQFTIDLLKPWMGGMSWHGGLIFATLAGYLYTRKLKLSFWQIADTITPYLFFGVFIIRIANFINGELPGVLVDQRFGFLFPGVSGYRAPQSLYESALALILLITYIFYCKIARTKVPDGSMFLCSVALLSIGRFIIEFWRLSDMTWLHITGGQWLSIVTLCVTLLSIRFSVYSQNHKS